MCCSYHAACASSRASVVLPPFSLVVRVPWHGCTTYEQHARSLKLVRADFSSAHTLTTDMARVASAQLNIADRTPCSWAHPGPFLPLPACIYQ